MLGSDAGFHGAGRGFADAGGARAKAPNNAMLRFITKKAFPHVAIVAITAR
jgi:hypothetical protein